MGPPACVGMKVFESERDLETIEQPDGLHFVGAISSSRLVLQQVVATAVIVETARRRGDVIIVDTPDALLVCASDRAEEIKQVLDEISAATGDQYL